jgi:DNA-binding NarL/FixJ family response regulator
LRLLIVDDSPEFLAAARNLLVQQGIDVVGVARNADEALAAAQDLNPDATLVDVNLGPDDGFALARDLAAPDGLGGLVVMISTRPEDGYAELIAESPAVGFLAKTALSADAIEQLIGWTA